MTTPQDNYKNRWHITENGKKWDWIPPNNRLEPNNLTPQRITDILKETEARLGIQLTKGNQ